MRIFGNDITFGPAEGREASSLTALGLYETRDAIDNPAIPLNSPAAWGEMFGGPPTASGELITESNALNIPTVYACVRVLSKSVAATPLEMLERTDAGHQKATDSSLYYLLTVQP